MNIDFSPLSLALVLSRRTSEHFWGNTFAQMGEGLWLHEYVQSTDHPETKSGAQSTVYQWGKLVSVSMLLLILLHGSAFLQRSNFFVCIFLCVSRDVVVLSFFYLH